MRALVEVVAAYLLGSIPTGLWLGRLVAGIDVRHSGSRRIGATNVRRSLGTRAGILVLLLDVLKGAIPVLVVRAAGGNEYLAAAAGLAAMVGHVWPLFAGFRGGRGVATSGGVVLCLSPPALAAALALLVLVVAITRYVSLGSIVGGLAAPVLAALFSGRLAQSEAAVPLALLAGCLIVARHADNLQRILAGTENRIGRSAPHP